MTKSQSVTKSPFFRHLSVLMLLCVAGVTCAAISPEYNSNYLDSLDSYLKKTSYYTDIVMSRINKDLANLDNLPDSQRFESMAQIGRSLEQINLDSAFVIYRRAERLALAKGNSKYYTLFRYRKGGVMPLMGLVREGISIYQSVNPAAMPPSERFDFYITGKHIFDAAVDYYRIDSLKQKYKALSNLYADSAAIYVNPNSRTEAYYKALTKLKGSDARNGIIELEEVLTQIPMDHQRFAKVAAEIASAYLGLQDLPKAKYYLALSAIADLKAGTREATSLHRLGKLLSNEEDYSRAYDYLIYALDAAVASGSSLRTIEIGEIMPAAVKAGRQLEQRRNNTLVGVVITLSVALLVLAIITVYAHRTRKRLYRARKRLVSINDSKDLYIRKLLSLCGVYLNAMENFNKMAARKIKVGQINEVLAMIESGKIVREQLQTFYDVVDDAFLAVYPDFVNEVNKLLLPDKQLSQTDDGHLGTELRILAFMRLGLEDSTQIARFLGLSLNTIYTYRNKVKSRAINRETFENEIRNIGRDTDK